MKLLRHANHIIQLAEDGKIAKQGKFEDLRQSLKFAEHLEPANQKGSESADEPPNSAENIPQSTQTEDESDNTRQRGDFSIYKYYVSAMGWGSLSIYASVLAFEATASAMQCMFSGALPFINIADMLIKISG